MSSKSKASRAKSTAVLSTMVLLGIFAAFTPKTWARYSGGTGEPNDPYRIATAENLNDIGDNEEDWDKHFILVNDVNLAGYTGTQFNIIYEFTGVFDGNDHKIQNFTWSSTGVRDRIGLFGLLEREINIGEIKNLYLENVDVNAINGKYVSGLVGYNSHGTIINCYSTGSVSGKTDVGGLVGGNAGEITKCYSTGNIMGTTEHAGGLVGWNVGMITYCYSTGDVTGNVEVGGLVGYNEDGSIADCYSAGSVSGSDLYVGGLVGNEDDGFTKDSFWDIETSGQSASASGTPKTTVQMKTMSTFTDAGWDFVEIWGIGENQTYPYLRTEPAGDSNYDKKVNLIDLAILASHWLEEH